MAVVGDDERLIQNRLRNESVKDKAFPSLTSKILRLTDSLNGGQEQKLEEWDKSMDSAKLDLASYLETQERSRFIISRHIREIDDSSELQKKIRQRMESAEAQIETLKVLLTKERKIRAHKEECERLANLIQAHPPRADQVSRINKLKSDIGKLEQKKRRVEGKVLLRKKQFNLVIQAVKALHAELEDERVAAVDDADDGNGAQDDSEMADE